MYVTVCRVWGRRGVRCEGRLRQIRGAQYLPGEGTGEKMQRGRQNINEHQEPLVQGDSCLGGTEESPVASFLSY